MEQWPLHQAAARHGLGQPVDDPLDDDRARRPRRADAQEIPFGIFERHQVWVVKTLGLTREEPYPVFMPFANRQPWGPYRDLSKRLGRRPYSS